MSTLLSVTYNRSLGYDNPELRQKFQEGIPQLQQLPGLIWKIWTSNPKEETGAGFYLFDTEENARKWGDGQLQETLKNVPTTTDIEVKYWEVEEDFSQQTFATLTRNNA